MSNETKIPETAIKNDVSFRRRADYILSERAKIAEDEQALQDELAAVRKAHENLEKRKAALSVKEKEAEAYATAHKDRIFADSTKTETKVAVITLASCPPSVVLSNQKLTDDIVIKSLRDVKATEDFVATKYSLDRPAIKNELQKPGSKLAPLLKKAGLKLKTDKTRFSIKAK